MCLYRSQHDLIYLYNSCPFFILHIIIIEEMKIERAKNKNPQADDVQRAIYSIFIANDEFYLNSFKVNPWDYALLIIKLPKKKNRQICLIAFTLQFLFNLLSAVC